MITATQHLSTFRKSGAKNIHIPLLEKVEQKHIHIPLLEKVEQKHIHFSSETVEVEQKKQKCNKRSYVPCGFAPLY
jgi:hypothetical protein